MRKVPFYKVRMRVILFALIVGLLILFLWLDDFQHYTKKLIITQYSLRHNRDAVKIYKNITGNYPPDLDVLEQFAKENKIIWMKEYVRLQANIKKEKYSEEEILKSAQDLAECRWVDLCFPRGESITTRHWKTNVQVSNELNGKGGLYYNKETGEVRVNVTKPLKHYFIFYFGEERNDVAAEW